MLGIGGVLTFKNSGLDEVVKDIDIQHLVLETDSPYLAPVPHRGKRNESAYTALVAQKLADIKQMPVEELARITTENSVKLFGI
jgi:TatD DNase family protein